MAFDEQEDIHDAITRVLEDLGAHSVDIVTGEGVARTTTWDLLGLVVSRGADGVVSVTTGDGGVVPGERFLKLALAALDAKRQWRVI